MTIDPRITTPECSFRPCGDPAHVKGLCRAHYMQQRRVGTLTEIARTADRRIDPWKKCAIGHCTSVVAVKDLCTSHKGIPYRFGISQDRYIEIMLDAVCAVCGTESDLNMDHAHRHCPKGKGCMECFRGILCTPCNMVLGRVDDNPERLRGLADYLEK